MNVLVTGANRGIGLGFVDHYLRAGCEVWACYRSTPGALAERSESKLHLLRWDISVAGEDSAPQDSELPSVLDLLINNAGVYGPSKAQGQSLEGVTAEAMRDVFDVNCIGAIRVVQRLWPRLERAKGVIANVSSKMGSSADNTSGGCYAYRAAKAALVIVSKSMAVDLEPRGVRVITLHPGWVRTDMTDHTGLVDVGTSVAGLTQVINDIDSYESGAFVAFDGSLVPY